MLFRSGILKNNFVYESNSFVCEIINTFKYNELIIHKAKVVKGKAELNEEISAIVDNEKRKDITIHHSTLHLLQSALRNTLGDTVAQAGSQVEPNRARFDFTFDRALSQKELTLVENTINDWINQNIKRETIETTIEHSRELGAIALFDEKYGDKVRLVTIGDVSKELCGGTHVESTGEIRLCKIISESAIASGVRRIELVSGKYAVEYVNNLTQELHKTSQLLKIPQIEVFSRVEKIIEESKNYQKRIKNLETELAEGKVTLLVNEAKDIQGGKLLIARVDGLTPDILKASAEKLGDKLGNSIVVLASVFDEKISIVSKVSQNFIDIGANAGQIVNEIATFCDGKGGGRPNFAQAGAKNVEKLNNSLNSMMSKYI